MIRKIDNWRIWRASGCLRIAWHDGTNCWHISSLIVDSAGDLVPSSKRMDFLEGQRIATVSDSPTIYELGTPCPYYRAAQLNERAKNG